MSIAGKAAQNTKTNGNRTASVLQKCTKGVRDFPGGGRLEENAWTWPKNFSIEAHTHLCPHRWRKGGEKGGQTQKKRRAWRAKGKNAINMLHIVVGTRPLPKNPWFFPVYTQSLAKMNFT